MGLVTSPVAIGQAETTRTPETATSAVPNESGPPQASPEVRLITAECFGVATPTFQGEGPSTGHPALFIRLSRCNLTCARCDTKYTWDWSQFDPREQSQKRSVADLAAWAASSAVDLVVITGGEPLLQQRGLAVLVPALLAAGKRVEFETNGTIAPDPALLIDGVRFNVSPKLASFGVLESRSIVPSALEAFAESGRAVFKFVAAAVSDLERVAELAEAHRLAPVWVMPEGTTPRRSPRRPGSWPTPSRPGAGTSRPGCTCWPSPTHEAADPAPPERSPRSRPARAPSCLQSRSASERTPT